MAQSAWQRGHLPDLTGRRYLITGSTRGLGYFSTEKLVRAGAHVIMTGRSPNRLAAAHAAIRRRVIDAAGSEQTADAASDVSAFNGSVSNGSASNGSGANGSRNGSRGGASGGVDRLEHPRPGSVETLLLDTSNLGSVRAAAATAHARGPLHGLLLNAGIVHAPSRRHTAGGHEMVFATNVLGHFALAGEMLQNLAVVGGRMVWVGSLATSLGAHPLVDPELTDDYTPWRAYVQSKVAATALGLEADRRLRAAGVPASSVVAHPGYAISGRTEGVRGINDPTLLTRFIDNLQTPIARSKAQGARSLVRALVDPDIEGGQFWGPRFLVHGAPHRARPARITRDPELAARLWEYCTEASRTRWPFEKAARARRRR